MINDSSVKTKPTTTVGPLNNSVDSSKSPLSKDENCDDVF